MADLDLGRLFGGMGIGQGLAGLGGGLYGLFSGFQDPMKNAYPYFNQIPGMIQGTYGPYAGLGQQAISPLMHEYGNNLNLGNTLQNTFGQMTGNNYGQLQNQYNQMAGNLGALQGQYGQLMNDPGAMISKLGQGFQASPGYKYQVDQATQAANAAAAAGGMLGSPAQQQALAQQIGGMANQDYNNYMNRAQGLYGTGLSGLQGLQSQGLAGLQGLFNTGLSGQQGLYGGSLSGMQNMAGLGAGAAGNMAQALQNYLMSRGSAEYANAQNRQQQNAMNWNNILGGLGSLLGGGLMFGGR